MTREVYVLPGRGGRLDSGLGLALLARGVKVSGRELVGDFQRLSFAQQIETIADDLQTFFWHERAIVIANSFGAYLLLHAQTLLPAYVGKVVLLSPIVGSATNEANMMHFVPPREGVLEKLLDTGTYRPPVQGEIHVGMEDWQSDPDYVQSIGLKLKFPVHLVPGAGHSLPKEYVSSVLDRTLS